MKISLAASCVRHMTTAEIAGLLGARQNGQSGYTARCPAHDDKNPSLAVREGRDGRTLIRCFAGCEPVAIVHAIGLDLRDLFDGVGFAQSIVQQRRTMTADDLEHEIQGELRRILDAESERTGFPEVATLVRHRNAARAIIERRFDLHLKREQPLWSEVEPYCTDPAWTACIDQAMSVIAGRGGGLRVGDLLAAIRDLPKTQQRILRIARFLQRSLAGGRAASAHF
jgi:hypothetical protein